MTQVGLKWSPLGAEETTQKGMGSVLYVVMKIGIWRLTAKTSLFVTCALHGAETKGVRM